jgi:PAS domain S-box-containing protein
MLSLLSSAGPTPYFRQPVAAPAAMAMIELDALGAIRDVNAAAQRLFGYDASDLLGSNIALLLPQFGASDLFRGDTICPRLAYLCRCGMAFEGVARDGSRFDCELFLNLLGPAQARILAMLLRKAESSPSHRVGAGNLQSPG